MSQQTTTSNNNGSSGGNGPTSRSSTNSTSNSATNLFHRIMSVSSGATAPSANGPVLTANASNNVMLPRGSVPGTSHGNAGFRNALIPSVASNSTLLAVSTSASNSNNNNYTTTNTTASNSGSRLNGPGTVILRNPHVSVINSQMQMHMQQQQLQFQQLRAAAANRPSSSPAFRNSNASSINMTYMSAGGGSSNVSSNMNPLSHHFSQHFQQAAASHHLYPPQSRSHTSHSHSHNNIHNINNNNGASVHPHFRAKIVCQLTCRFCTKLVCIRGMKAILLADANVELFSTDSPPKGVQLVEEDYTTANCRCKIRDLACLTCGNIIGYHVTQPCDTCLESCNNGHFWMFLSDSVASKDRLDSSGDRAMLWAHLPYSEGDSDFLDPYDFGCR